MSTSSGESSVASEPGIALSVQQRTTLARLGDELIPAAEGMPSAAAAGVAGPWLDEVLRLRPDFRLPLVAMLDRFVSIDANVAIANLQASDPNGFFVLTEVVAGGYFLNPLVRDAVGYPGQESLPIVAEDPPDYEQDGLLASVVARGPIYRPTPAGPS